MGWLFQHDPLAHETPADYFTREFTHESKTTKATVLATATVRGTVYAAIRNLNKQTGYSYVFCAVILFKNSKREGFGYKDMDETMGPCEVDCPDRIMRLLSPIEHIPNPGYAADWRTRVSAAKANAAKTRNTLTKMKVGDNVKLAIPAYFSKGKISTDLFTLLRFDKRTPIFVAVEHPWLVCRLRKTTLAGATISRDCSPQSDGPASPAAPSPRPPCSDAAKESSEKEPKAMNNTTTTDETIATRRQSIEAALAAHCGSLERTRHWTRRLIYTPGIADMAELCGAYWLIDLIGSHQIDQKVAAEEFQLWTLNVEANQTGFARATDGNDKLIASQQIEFTDFPLDEIKLYLVQGTLMLPGEY